MNDHKQFPLHSTNLCLLNMMPWNKSQWDEYDTEYASNALFNWNRSEGGTFGIFETTILWAIPQSEVLFALNLFVPDDSVNYVDLITQKMGIAKINNNINDYKDFFNHAIKQNILTEEQRNNIEKNLQ